MDNNGQVDKLAAAHDLAEVQVVTEDEINVAIDELNRSTQSINKQSDALQLQKQALDRLAKKRSENESRRRTLEASVQRKSDLERKKLAAEVIPLQ